MAVRYLCFKNDREIKWKSGAIKESKGYLLSMLDT